MATPHRPLLDKPKSLKHKNLCLILSLVAVFSSAAFIIFQLIVFNGSNNGSLTHVQICERAHDRESCHVLLTEFAGSSSESISLSKLERLDLLQVFLNKSVLLNENTIKTVDAARNKVNGPRDKGALADCAELMDLSMDRMVSSMGKLTENPNSESYGNVHSWLSSVLTNYMTCLDGINDSFQVKAMIEPRLNDLVSRARTALAIFVSVSPAEDRLIKPVINRFPDWLTVLDRKLLESSPKDLKVNANVVVAKDGSGKYKTVTEAVAAAPEKGKDRYVIYVKKGVYKENVEVGKKKTNLMLVGDGMQATIITGNLNVIDGSTTFKSATVAAVGDGFIAQDIWFQNTAGPEKHQAVALRVGADKSVINRCRIDAFQDTLYAHSLRQFYRDCYITGTVDFIFGNAAVVFQACKIVARKPMKGQNNMVTAQGQLDPNQDTGTSIQKCNVIASSDLEPVKGSIKTYLGRPWKEYSRTVFMQSYLGDHIDPTGWSPWDGQFALSTLYYGEYQNNGPGSDTSKRVKWKGYRVIKDPKEAEQFTVAKLIQGDIWLKSTGVNFQPWL